MLIKPKITYGYIVFALVLCVAYTSPAQTAANNQNVPFSDTSNQVFALGSIPANDIYQGKWDNNYIKVYKNLLPNKPDSVLILFSGVENIFTMPCSDVKIISQFGYRGKRVHSGVDIKQKTGSPIVSAFDGKVRLAKYSKGYGNVVVVRHFNGLETVYAHLSKIIVKVNQDVKSGELIGLAGSTGRATASHLHFETRFLGEAFNPEKIIDFTTSKLRQDSFEIRPATFVVNQNAHLGSPIIDTSVADTLSSVKKENETKTIYHTIKKGDTLYSLARKNGTTVQAICKLNHITPSTTLKLGKVLRIK